METTGKIRAAWLRYDGLWFRERAVLTDGRLFRRLKSGKWKPVKKHLTSDGYGYWKVKCPATGKFRRVTVSRAVQESFAPAGTCIKGLVAAHRAGTKRSDGAFDACVLKTHKGNRHDRRETGTQGTRDTIPGKLSAADVLELLTGFDSRPSKSYWARRFDVTRQAIRNQLNKSGRA